MQCLYMENKVDYYQLSRQIINEVDSLKEKPRLLLHACCGPCSTFPLVDLCPHFNVTIYFNNSNIYPESEYYRRLEELKKFLECFEKDYHFHVDLVVTSYNNDLYNKSLELYKNFPEGSIRCICCYEKRMDEAYNFANENKFDYFTTVMSISRQKNSQVLNLIGEKLSKKYKTKFFYSDFKKHKGQDYAREMRLHYNLYQQQYCGCIYSFDEYLTRIKRNV